MQPTPWIEENVELLKRLYAEGLSTTLIAEEFNRRGYTFTRNSIIGKVHRLKLEPPEGRKWTRQRQPAKTHITPKSTIRLRQYVRPVKEQIVMKTPTAAKNVLLRETTDGQCRAIVGYRNGILADAICCGEHAPQIVNRYGRLTASPWCHFHRDKYIEKKVYGRDR